MRGAVEVVVVTKHAEGWHSVEGTIVGMRRSAAIFSPIFWMEPKSTRPALQLDVKVRARAAYAAWRQPREVKMTLRRTSGRGCR